MNADWDLAQRLLALLALIALAPLLLLLFVLVRATSAGPFLVRQLRLGLGGRLLTVVKIRTTYVGSEETTPLGRLLRELKLDELPQLWNVWRGDMVFVGPRPIPIQLEHELTRHISGFSARRRVKPGLTNLAEVTVLDNGVGDDLVADWRVRFEAERHCQRHQSAAYDCVLIALTVLFVLRKVLRRIKVWPRGRPLVSAKDCPRVTGAVVRERTLLDSIARPVRVGIDGFVGRPSAN